MSYSIFRIYCPEENFNMVGYTGKQPEKMLEDKIYYCLHGRQNSNENLDSIIKKHKGDNIKMEILEDGISSEKIARGKKFVYQEEYRLMSMVPWDIKI